MNIRSITVALDVDGVLLPLVDSDDASRHERETGWSFTQLEGQLPLTVAAAEVLSTIRQLVSEEAPIPTTVLWHTSWRYEASRSLAPTLDLPGLTGGEETQFATTLEYRNSSNWWKLAAVERWLREHPVQPDGTFDRLIWIDDDAADSIRSGEISRSLLEDDRLVIITPSIHNGIEPGELALLRRLTGLD